MPCYNDPYEYDPDGECLENSISKIGKYFSVNFTNEKISQIRDNKNIYLIDLFENENLNAYAYFSKISLINPFNLFHFLKFWRRIRFERTEFNPENFGSDKICVLMHFSFFSLYGISGPWHHYIVYYFQDEKFLAHDELREKLVLEFPKLRMQLSFEEAWLAASTKMVIWK
jgi:hypothetical protein